MNNTSTGENRPNSTEIPSSQDIFNRLSFLIGGAQGITRVITNDSGGGEFSTPASHVHLALIGLEELLVSVESGLSELESRFDNSFQGLFSRLSCQIGGAQGFVRLITNDSGGGEFSTPATHLHLALMGLEELLVTAESGLNELEAKYGRSL